MENLLLQEEKGKLFGELFNHMKLLIKTVRLSFGLILQYHLTNLHIVEQLAGCIK